MEHGESNYETAFPFEEGQIYKDRGIFKFLPAKVTLPLDFSTFDSLHITPFQIMEGDEKVPYRINISFGRNRYRKETKIELYVGHGPCDKRLDVQKQWGLYNVVSLFWKNGDKHENADGEKLRQDILDYCQKSGMLVYEYTSTDPSRSVEP